MKHFATSYLVLIFALASAVSTALASDNALRRILLGTRDRSDTILLELDRPVKSKMATLPDQYLEIRLEGAELAPAFVPPVITNELSLVRSLVVSQDSNSVLILTIQLTQDAEPSAWTLSTKPWQYIVNLAPKAASGQSTSPQWIPGDRPIRTKYAETKPSLPIPLVPLSRFSLTALLALAFAAGAAAVFILVKLMDWAERKVEPAPSGGDIQPLATTDVTEELSHDLMRLTRIADREQHQIAESAAANAERVQLILQMIREGREISSIAQVLEMTPEQVRDILERHT